MNSLLRRCVHLPILSRSLLSDSSGQILRVTRFQENIMQRYIRLCLVRVAFGAMYNIRQITQVIKKSTNLLIRAKLVVCNHMRNERIVDCLILYSHISRSRKIKDCFQEYLMLIKSCITKYRLLRVIFSYTGINYFINAQNNTGYPLKGVLFEVVVNPTISALQYIFRFNKHTSIEEPIFLHKSYKYYIELHKLMESVIVEDLLSFPLGHVPEYKYLKHLPRYVGLSITDDWRYNNSCSIIYRSLSLSYCLGIQPLFSLSTDALHDFVTCHC